MKQAFLFLIVFLCSLSLVAQKKGNLVVISNSLADVHIDGKWVGQADNNVPLNFSLQAGEHLILVKALHPSAMGQEKKQIIVLTAGQQSIVESEFTVENTPMPTASNKVVEMDFIIQGKAEKKLADWVDMDDTDAVYYFSFNENDLLKINFALENKQGVAGLKITNYNTKEIVYANENLSSMNNFSLPILKTGVYKFKFTTKHSLNRKAHLHITKENSSFSN